MRYTVIEMQTEQSVTAFNTFLATAIVQAAFRTNPRQGKIDAIKQLRAETGLGLKRSKDIIEAVERDFAKGYGTSETTQVVQEIMDASIIPETVTPPKPEPEVMVVISGKSTVYKAKSIEEAKRFTSWQAEDDPYYSTKVFVEQV